MWAQPAGRTWVQLASAAVQPLQEEPETLVAGLQVLVQPSRVVELPQPERTLE